MKKIIITTILSLPLIGSLFGQKMSSQELVTVSTSQVKSVSYPVLDTPYNNSIKDRSYTYHLFGSYKNNKAEYADIKNTYFSHTLDQLKFQAWIQENGFELEAKKIDDQIKELAAQGIYYIINIKDLNSK